MINEFNDLAGIDDEHVVMGWPYPEDDEEWEYRE